MQAFLKIKGEPCSKANSRRVVKFGARTAMIKSQKALNYAKAFKQQCERYDGAKFVGDVEVSIWIWYASRRPDLDVSLILDLLQDVTYANDRQVKQKHIYWMGVSKENPRCEILVKSI